MPLQATSGAASYDAFGGGVPVVPAYIEEVFGTFLYTGNGSTQTITNGIDLSGKGGLVWTKPRSNVTGDFPFNDHILVDSARGDFQIQSNTTAANNAITSFDFSSTGYTAPSNLRVNQSTYNYVSWTFRKQAKFFDVVTYTGTGANTTIAHNLGSVPACIIVKRTDTTGAWQVYHRSLANTEYLVLNTTAAKATGATWWNSTTPTSTVFSLGTDATVNASGGTYVAYIFAHDAGGFGLTGTDNVISCGSYVGDGTTNGSKKITLGYEPQFIIMKPAQAAPSGFNGWNMLDIMRGIPTGGYDPLLSANSGGSEDTTNDLYSVEADGFRHTYAGTAGNDDGITYLYIAIRRGPMKVPTSGTSVFSPVLWTSTNSDYRQIDTGIVPDAHIFMRREASTRIIGSRLQGINRMFPTNTNAEQVAAVSEGYDNRTSQTTFTASANGATAIYNSGAEPNVGEFFRRAPSFFDEVCYIGTGSGGRTVTHNLTVAPEFVIVKKRSGEEFWGTLYVATSSTGALNSTAGLSTSNNQYYFGNDTVYVAPTASVFTVGSVDRVNASGGTYVAYLFATCAGVSKVFSYTGNGSSQTINCGFTSGARFVLIKRTDSSGDWYVWDSARGIVSGNDPHLSLNTTAAEVTTDDTIDTDSTGFVVNQVSATDVNVSSATYIGLAIA